MCTVLLLCCVVSESDLHSQHSLGKTAQWSGPNGEFQEEAQSHWDKRVKQERYDRPEETLRSEVDPCGLAEYADVLEQGW
jgi:hypothetical protein